MSSESCHQALRGRWGVSDVGDDKHKKGKWDTGGGSNLIKLPAMFPRIPESEVSSDGGSEATGAQELDPKDPSGPKIGGLQLPRIYSRVTSDSSI